MVGKKYLIAVLVGAFVITGVAVPFITRAADKPGGQPPDRGPDMMAQSVAQEFGLSKDEVEKYMHQRVAPHELMHAAMLAKISGKPFAEILSMKNLANTWPDVEQSLGVTKEQIKAVMEESRAAKLASQLNIAQDAVAGLLKDGYHPHDIAAAAKLAQATQKPITEILAMKTINNQWPDVARSLGVDPNAVKPDKPEMGPGMPMHGPQGGPGPCPPGGPEMNADGPGEP